MKATIRLRKLGYAPYHPTADGREFISYPFRLESGGYGIMVREIGDPTTMSFEHIPPEALDYLNVFDV